jgi:cytochrome c biogenesis protein CcmG/thiol:disulfide interchange protein DsbE
MTSASRVARPLTALVALVLVLGACGGDEGAGNPQSAVSEEEATRPLQGAPAQLAAVREQANELLGGGVEALRARLAELEGTPVVVNKWASWCGPCRLEFPFFQSQATERGGQIAFLGVDSNDSEGAAETFLQELPLPYPSYLDPDQELAREIGAPVAFPATAFYDSSGNLAYTHQGVYESEEELIADIRRYAK